MSLSSTWLRQPTRCASETAPEQYSWTASLAFSARSMSSDSNSWEGAPLSFSGVGSMPPVPPEPHAPTAMTSATTTPQADAFTCCGVADLLAEDHISALLQ